MPSTELCVIHPGGLSASCWSRLASHLPAGTPVKVLELETINRYWADDPDLTVDALAERLRGPARRRRAARVLVGWGVGGVVAEALAARWPGRRGASSCSTGSPRARATPSPTSAQLLRSFAMYAGARRGRTLAVDPARLSEGLEPGARPHPRAWRSPPARCAPTRRSRRSGAATTSTPRRVLRDHRLISGAHARGHAADRRQGRAAASPRRARRSAGTASARSRSWPAAATTTRC